MGVRPRGLLFATVLALGITASAPALAQGRADLEKARAAYHARNYAEAEERLLSLTNPETGVKELTLLSQARMYLGAVLLAQGKREQAVDVFEKLILEDPPFEPDPLGYPTDVVNTFIDVRVQLQERIRQAVQNAAKLEAEKRARAAEEKRRYEEWLNTIKAMAMEEKITVRRSRLVACMPFGAGQLQNGNLLLGFTLFGAQAALVAGTAITVPMNVYARRRAEEEARSGDLEGKASVYDQRADDIRTVNLSLAGGFALLAVVGIVEANLAFVPEKVETRPRPGGLPPVTPPSSGSLTQRLKPVVAPSPSGLFVGLTGVMF